MDPQSRNAILETVTALSREGTAILYTSHYMAEVEQLCNRVGIVDAGRMVAEGTRRELVARLGQNDRVDLATRHRARHARRGPLALEIVPPAMQALGRAVPHSWAVEALREVGSHGGTLSDVLVPLAVLAGFAATLLAVATWRLGVTLRRA